MLWTKEFRCLTQIRRKEITLNYFEELQLTSGYVTKAAVPRLAKRQLATMPAIRCQIIKGIKNTVTYRKPKKKDIGNYLLKLRGRKRKNYGKEMKITWTEEERKNRRRKKEEKFALR